jgi:hypothetical protein
VEMTLTFKLSYYPTSRDLTYAKTCIENSGAKAAITVMIAMGKSGMKHLTDPTREHPLT